MDPQDLANIIKALDELVETAIKDTVNNRDFDGLNLLDYVNNQSYTYDDLISLFPRDDGLLIFGPYDLESLVGAGRSDLNLVIEPIVSDADETIEKIRVSLRDQNTVGSSGPNNFRQDIDKLFMLDLGEFSTLEEMENLFTQTSDIDGTTAKVSLVGDKLDEIFPNSTANIEMALTNQMPIVSDRIRQEINRDFVPDYIKEAFELIDKEQATQYSELAGDVEVPDTPEGAAADIVPDDISSIDTPTNVVDDLPFTDDDIAEITNDYVKNNWGEQKTTADGVVMRINDNNELEVLLIKRKRGPHRGDWALPGGIQDQATLQLFAEAELSFINNIQDDAKLEHRIYGDVANNIDKTAMTTQFTALKELAEEVGLDIRETYTSVEQLTPKYNRFNWDARATKGVNIGGTFVFVRDNDWQPKAGDDALKAEWKTVKSILDGDTKLAFGHGEWIKSVLQNKNLIKRTGIDKLFDDNIAYIYGLPRPENTLGTYGETIDTLKKINNKNKSNITSLIEAANKVRVTKGMPEIPLDRSNIQGSAESVIKNMRLGYGDPAEIQRYMQPENFIKGMVSDTQIHIPIDISDFDEESFMNEFAEQDVTVDDFKNQSDNLKNVMFGEKVIEAKLNEKGIDNVARQMQEKMIENIDRRVVNLYHRGFADEVILDELRNIYLEKVDTDEFLNVIKTELLRYQDEFGPITSGVSYHGKIHGLNIRYAANRNIFSHAMTGPMEQVISDAVKSDKQLSFLSDVFNNEFMTLEPVEFWQKYGSQFGEPGDRLTQRSSYLKDGKLYFQTNHGTPGPSEPVLDFIQSIENKYGNDLNYFSIASGLKGQRPIFFDNEFSFVDPTIGRTGLIGPVLYTTTSPFFAAGYGTGSNDSTSVEDMRKLIIEDIQRFVNNNKTNTEMIDDVIEEAKKHGILIEVLKDKNGQYYDFVKNVATINPNVGLSTANIANISGSVNEENILKINQSTLPGQGDIKLQNFWQQILNEFDENWFQRDLENGTGFVNIVPRGEFSFKNSKQLNPEIVPYIALQKPRDIPGVTNISSLDKYFKNKMNIDPDVFPNLGYIVGDKMGLVLSKTTRSQENWKFVKNQIKKVPLVGFEDQGALINLSTVFDKYHKYFDLDTSLNMQLISDYAKAAIAIDNGDYILAGKLLGIENLDGQWVPLADQINDNIKDAIYNKFSGPALETVDIRKKSVLFGIETRLKTILKNEDEWNKNFLENTRMEKYNNFYKENNLPPIVNSSNLQDFVDTVNSFDLNSPSEYKTNLLDRKIFTMAGNNGYEVTLSTGGNFVGKDPHWVIGIIDPTNKLQTNQPKTLDVQLDKWAFLKEDDAEIIKHLAGESVENLTDGEIQIMAKYMNPNNILDLDITEEQLKSFDALTKEKGVYWDADVGDLSKKGTGNLSVRLMIKEMDLQKLHVAHQLGQVPKEVVVAEVNSIVKLVADAPDDLKAKFFTGATNTMDIINKYAKPGIGTSLKYGAKAADKFDKWVLGPAAIDILASRISGPGSQYETIGGALADTMARYEDETPDSVIEMLYGNKNVPEAKNLVGVNIAYPVTQSIEYGKDKFREYVYDNNLFGIQSIVNFIKPKAIEALKTVTDKAGLNDWVYNVKRDMVVEMIMQENNIPYTKTNIDLYTKNYEEQNPREVDRFGNELPDNYDTSWASSIPETYLARDFRVDERIRTGDRYARSGGGGGQLKE